MVALVSTIAFCISSLYNKAADFTLTSVDSTTVYLLSSLDIFRKHPSVEQEQLTALTAELKKFKTASKLKAPRGQKNKSKE